MPPQFRKPPDSVSREDPAAVGGADPQEIERIFREHNAALLRFVAAKLGSKHEAKEVAQEAYVRLLQLDHCEAVSYLRAFLFKTAANLAMDRLRQRARRHFIKSTRDVDFAVFELSPERQMAGEEGLQRLRVAIDELPVKCRESFLLHRVHGLSCLEIGQRLGIQDRMVRLYVARALEYLRGRVEGESATQLQKEIES